MGKRKQNRSVAVVVSTWNDDLRWLLDDPTRSENPIMRTLIYQGANVDHTTGRPILPAAPTVELPLSAWPAWAEDIIRHEWWEHDDTPDGLKNLKDSLRGQPVVVGEISPLPLRLIPNQKTEEAAFVAGMYDLYDEPSLPDVVLFMHGHNRSWHTAVDQGVMLRLLKSKPPNPGSGYADLLCRMEPGHPGANHLYLNDLEANVADGPREAGWQKGEVKKVRKAWDELLGKYMGPLPNEIVSPCCGTFAATSTALRLRPKILYEKMLPWLYQSEAVWGGLLEYLWQLLLSGRPVEEADQMRCLCEVYGLCT
jgi:hypothetical protein